MLEGMLVWVVALIAIALRVSDSLSVAHPEHSAAICRIAPSRPANLMSVDIIVHSVPQFM